MMISGGDERVSKLESMAYQACPPHAPKICSWDEYSVFWSNSRPVPALDEGLPADVILVCRRAPTVTATPTFIIHRGYAYDDCANLQLGTHGAGGGGRCGLVKSSSAAHREPQAARPPSVMVSAATSSARGPPRRATAAQALSTRAGRSGAGRAAAGGTLGSRSPPWRRPAGI